MDGNCDNFDAVSEKCLECIDGKYLSNDHCVDPTEYWDTEAAEGSEITDIGIADCNQVSDDKVDGELYCTVCSNDVIPHNGRCCDEGTTYNRTLEECIPIH